MIMRTQFINKLLLFTILSSSLFAQDSLTSLSITSDPGGAKIFINGEIYGNTPNTIMKIKAGKCMIQLEKDGYLDWISNYDVTFNSSNKVHAILSPKTGQLKIDCDINGSAIYLDGKFVGRTPKIVRDVEIGKHVIQIGSRNIYLKGKAISVYKDTIEVSDTNIKELNIMLGSGWLSLTSKYADIKFNINGGNPGVLPVSEVLLERGPKEITLSKKGYESKNITVDIKGGVHHSLDVSLDPFTYSKIFYRSLFLPGLGQKYSNNNLKAALFSTVAIGTIVSAFVWDLKMRHASKSYKNIYNEYIISVNSEDLRILNRRLKKKYNEIEDHELTRNIFIGVAIINWIVNSVDAHFIGKEIEQFHSETSASFGASLMDSQWQIGINYKF